jgi:beta-mannosidase
MFADCWGEVGWTIVDYYLERKPAFYSVKRAFMPKKLILRSEGKTTSCVGINDSSQSITVELEYGVTANDGSQKRVERKTVSLKARSRETLFSFPTPNYDPRKEMVFVACTGDQQLLLPAVLRGTSFKDMIKSDPGLEVQSLGADGASMRYTISSKGWAHAVHFDLPEGSLADDEWFDLLPGEKRTIHIQHSSKIANFKLSAGSVL